VRRTQHLDAFATELQRVALGEGHEFEHRVLGAGQPGEVGPDDAVEDVRAQRCNRLGQGMHLDRPAVLRFTQADHAVGQQGDRQHMVEVRMADQDVVDARQRFERQVAHACTGVDQHVVVEQEGGGLATRCNGAGAAEDLKSHERVGRLSKGSASRRGQGCAPASMGLWWPWPRPRSRRESRA
jgi:hypothetical protein